MPEYYVYVYLRKGDLTPYYIGKGKGSRAYAKDHNVKVPTDKSRIIFAEKNLTDIGALAIERRLIRWYGRIDLGTGILRNKTDGGDGASNHVISPKRIAAVIKSNKERVWTEESRNKLVVANTGKRYSASTNAKKGWAVNQQWVTDPITSKSIRADTKDIPKYLADGWVKGRADTVDNNVNSGKKYVHNSQLKLRKMVPAGEVEGYLQQGWALGKAFT